MTLWFIFFQVSPPAGIFLRNFKAASPSHPLLAAFPRYKHPLGPALPRAALESKEKQMLKVEEEEQSREVLLTHGGNRNESGDAGAAVAEGGHAAVVGSGRR